ncbi:hypothetical protein AMTRI_Chr06g201220 [Amborella trichopoda]|uniref:outer envelope pore protein 37, chloroplastic n=1 Tax=Amborella trichopoda TaxID=13333 RepID=UPI0005D36194|nr:outer envelope pore protein 37, chloroplastic [Amborella trichopoda]|eukprot:XP_011628693.1 outer envelope pore protein 37, chloroplastic [Amborella trichopoda]
MRVAEAPPQNPNHNSSQQELPQNPSPNSLEPVTPIPPSPRPVPVPPTKLSIEFDSENKVFVNKISTKLFDGFAKLKYSFQRNKNGDIQYPQLGFVTKYLSVLYDHDERNAVISGCLDVGPRVQIKGVHDVSAQQGEARLIATLADPSYKLELVSSVPSTGPPRASLKFPYGEVQVEEKEVDEDKRVLSLGGILKGNVLNGVCSALHKDGNWNLIYAYKDDELTFIPSVALPSNVFSFAFKRRFSPVDKLSYLYNFYSNDWSAVYKHNFGDDLKLKVGYDSEVRLGWASFWVGKENAGAKKAPNKCKLQLMLQVPQDNPKAIEFLFRLKKRWDI